MPLPLPSPYDLDDEWEEEERLSCWFGGRGYWGWRVLDIQPKMAMGNILDEDDVERTRTLHMYRVPSLMASACSSLPHRDYERALIFCGGPQNTFATKARCVAFFANAGSTLIPVEKE